MKKGAKIAVTAIAVLLAAAAAGAGGFAVKKNSEGLPYDISSVEKIQNDVVIVSETEDSVTVKKNGDGKFRVLMFTDTHITDDPELNKTTVTYLVENIKEQKPDLVIFGGDNVTYGFNRQRNIELAELMEKLGVYWAAVLGNHEGEGFMAMSREKVINLYSSYEHCLLKHGKKGVDGHGNCTINILNSDGSLREVFFLMDSGSYMSVDSKIKYGVKNIFGEVYDGVKPSQVEWYKEKHDALTAQYGYFRSVAVIHIPPYEAEREYSESDFIYGEKREGVCESGFNSGLVDAMLEKGSTRAVYFGHDHVNDFGVMYEDILFSYIQTSGYDTYTMQSKFDSPENEWLQGCTVLDIKKDGTYTDERIFNHQ